MLVELRESERREVICEAGKKYSKVVEIWTFLGYYAAFGGNSLQMHRTTYRSHFQGSNLKVGPMGCPEVSVRNNHNTLRNTPEERRSQIQYFFAAIFRPLAHSVTNCGADQQAMKLTI